MEWAVKGIHQGGIPRKLAFVAVGAFSKAVATVLNTTDVHKADTLLRLVRLRLRLPGVPLITVINHVSTLDDLFCGDSSLSQLQIQNWRGGFLQLKIYALGIRLFRTYFDFVVLRLHTFPEGKVSQEDAPIRRLKWGTASLIDRAPITPIVLPIFHHGLHKMDIVPSIQAICFMDRASDCFPGDAWKVL